MRYSPGSTIADRYQIECLLGAGGIGTVYKARDIILDNFVAIKILHDDNDSDAIVRFQREAKTSGKLNHPHIATTIDFAQTSDGLSYLVMEYIEGKSLEEFVAADGPMDLDTSLAIFEQLSSAMAHAHANQILHRDLKPSNVILSKTESSIVSNIVDFGLAKPVKDAGITQTGVGVGSPQYMSPEQIRAQEVDERTDIYSFGCLMFKTLTGKVPHQGKTVLDTLNLHLTSSAPSINSFSNASYPSKLEKLVSDCLERAIESRIESFDLVNERVKQISEVEESTIISTEQTSSKETGQFPFAKVLIALASIGFIAIVGFLIQSILSEAPEPSKVKPAVTEAKIPTAEATEAELDKFEGGTASKLSISTGDTHKLRAVKVSDSDMPEMREMVKTHPKVSKLSITISDLTGNGLEKIEDLSQLKKLNFRDTSLASDCFSVIANMKQLTYLKFESNKEMLSLDSLKKICSIGNLQVLILDFPGVTDKHLVEIAKVKSLFRLDISSDTDITSDGLAKLRKLKKFRRLRISSKNLSPEFLELYPKFKRLRVLKFKPTKKIPESIIRDLRKKMKNCKVEVDESKAELGVDNFLRKSFVD